ncbi:MAG: endo-1,4-beta-xylanase [Candidatus Solibacter sp.]|nr:endo-1,4-beta-xylanase [Candidatus Solibacter sp.]
MLARAILATLLGAAAALADPAPLVSGDPLACFNRFDGAAAGGTLSTVTVDGMPFARALHVKTAAVSPTANAWDIRSRCFSTLAARKDDVVAVTFWMRAITAPDGRGLTSFVLERNDSPYTKSVTYTAAAGPDWQKFEVPFTIAETYLANAYNFSFWATFPNQEIEIGGISILDYGPGIAFTQLGLSTWPYAERAADAPWRAAPAARIDRYRRADLAVIARDDSGRPIPGAAVHVKMNRHAFGFGTAVAGDILQRVGADGDNYRGALKKLFNKVVTENALKWPPFESYGRAQADFMLPWFAANGFAMVRGHNVLWPGSTYLPADVQAMLKANSVDANALRTRVNKHIADVMAYAQGKLTEWDVLNEAYNNKDLQAVLGDAEMTSWFRQARAADPAATLYINDYSILEAGGYDLQHINGYARIIQDMLAAGAPIDGIGLQSHFDSNLTPPSRVFELLNRFAAFGKDLQVTEFDISLADEQVQADYTRDFLTVCFSHPAIKGFMIWGFWEGAHWKPSAAMIRRDWSTKPNYDAWIDLIYRQWWTDTRGVTASDGAFRTRAFLGDYDIEVTIDGVTKTYPLTLASHTQPAFVNIGKAVAGTIAPNGVVNAASYRGGALAPGEIVTIFGSGFGPAAVAAAQYADGQLPTSVGETRVLFNGTPAPMIYSVAGQVSAIVPYSAGGTVQLHVEYQGTPTAPVSVTVAAAAPGIFTCPNQPAVALAMNVSAGGVLSCKDDFLPPGPGSVVTIFLTGDGVLTPAIADGRLPTLTPYPAPAAQWAVNVGGIDAAPCLATFAGLVYAGVTQVNFCIPDGVPRTASVPITFRVGAASSATVTIDLRPS